MEQEGKEDSCVKLSRLQIIHPNLSLCICINVYDHCPYMIIVKIIDFQGGQENFKGGGGKCPLPS